MCIHGHLTKCVQEYGPTFGFRLFTMECSVNFPTIKKHIETEMQLHTLPLPQMFHEKFFHLLEGGILTKVNCLAEPKTKFGLYCLSNSDFRDDSSILHLKESTWKVFNRWKMKLLSTTLPSSKCIPGPGFYSPDPKTD